MLHDKSINVPSVKSAPNYIDSLNFILIFFYQQKRFAMFHSPQLMPGTQVCNDFAGRSSEALADACFSVFLMNFMLLLQQMRGM